jgi:hypothetical protein
MFAKPFDQATTLAPLPCVAVENLLPFCSMCKNDNESSCSRAFLAESSTLFLLNRLGVALYRYRMTPWNVTGMVDHDTGDVRGDLGFMLAKYMSESKCRSPYNTEACFLEDHTVVGAFDVIFDSNYGPYLKCNPNFLPGSDVRVNMSDWLCVSEPSCQNPVAIICSSV